MKIAPEMTNDDLSKEITDAWAMFTKDSEKAKETILSAFTDAPIPPKWNWSYKLGWMEEMENNEEEKMMIFFLFKGFLVFLLLAFLVYIVFSPRVKKND